MGEEKKLKASERLSILETLVTELSSTLEAVGYESAVSKMIIERMGQENAILKEALQLVHEKLDATILLQIEGSDLSEDNINKKIVSTKENLLDSRVKEQLELGSIVVAEEIGTNSFVVSRELNKDGSVENPRLQFLVKPLKEELQNKLIGLKVGELVVSDEEDKLNIEITEIYTILEEESAEEVVSETESLPEEREMTEQEASLDGSDSGTTDGSVLVETKED